jgi:hypothetical protein
MVIGEPRVEGQLKSETVEVEVGGVSGLRGRARLRDWPRDEMVTVFQLGWMYVDVDRDVLVRWTKRCMLTVYYVAEQKKTDNRLAWRVWWSWVTDV